MNSKMIDENFIINAVAQEAYSFLSTNLTLKNNQQKTNIIAVNSFKTGEGKTTTAINLAIAAARAGVNTLLVDGDLRKTRYISEYTKGLTDYQPTMDFIEIIRTTKNHSLHYVDSGSNSVDPVAFLSSDLFAAFLKQAALHYQMIIIDTPCSGEYVDGAMIAAKSSGALIVARANKTSYKNIARMKWQMEHVNANILGVVINQVSRSDYKSYFVV